MEIQFLFVRKYTENREIARHGHASHEFVYYFAGQGTSTIDDTDYPFEKDAYAIIAPNTPHAEAHIGSGHILAVGFTLDEGMEPLESRVYNGLNPHIYALTQKLKTEFITKEDLYEDMLQLLMRELVLLLRRAQIEAKRQKVTTSNDIGFAISYINEYFMTDINLEELAKSTGYCKDHFRNLFKEQTGQTPKSYILSKKLAYAKKLLRQRDLTLTDVASQCGFEYYSCFSAFFKKGTHMTPLHYRRTITLH